MRLVCTVGVGMGVRQLSSVDDIANREAGAGAASGAQGGVEPAVPDAALVAACRQGDQGAWELLVRRYERLIFSVALRNGVTKDEAADITQATFVALLESLGRLRDDERLASWLMSVARRLAWRQRRRSEREHGFVPDTGGMDDLIAAWERVAVVQEGLQRLGSRCRDLLLALYFDPAEPSYAEVARRLGRSAGGIGPMRARCLQRLRALLGEDAG
jgi:RNA polymerase sigma factor (sigma-70 family)